MATAGEQLYFDSALTATLNDLNFRFSLKTEQTTALESFKKKKKLDMVKV